ncbi:MAG: 30S ribosome-binding factor RbfA [Pedosphaera sp.]|nr:30S ribosome-binding factor RbfA [Pedosphaera sp.]
MQLNRRQERVAKLLKREVGEILRRELALDEVGLLTVNQVGVASDLKSATVFLGFVGTRPQRAAAPEKLEARAARIRMMLGSAIRLKFTPVLKFVLDDSIQEASRVLQILDEIERNVPAVESEK